MKKNGLGSAGLTVLTALGLVLLSARASAATIHVGHAGCTLADAIEAANDDVAVGACSAGSGADSLVLPQNATLVLHEALPAVVSELTIEGNGSTIVRDPIAPDFANLTVAHHGDLTLNETTVSGGSGGVSASDSTVTLNDCVISGNGGGVSNVWGDATVLNRTTVAGNAGPGVSLLAGTLSISQSAIVLNDGHGVYGRYTLIEIENSTVSSNAGAGVYADVLDVAGSTIVGNAGTGLFFFDRSGGLALSNSIVSGNHGSVGRELEFQDAYGLGLGIEGGHNIFGHDGDPGISGVAPGPTDIVPAGLLGSILNPELAANGGPTLTHLLRWDGPARDAGFECSALDQRGVTRPQGLACDVGALELVPDPCASASATLGCTVNGVPNVRCVGSTADDVIVGTPGPDVIFARSGNDVVWAAAGNDIVCGGDGNDALHGGSGADLLAAGPGDDSLSGDYGADSLNGGAGTDACGTDASDVSIVTCN